MKAGHWSDIHLNWRVVVIDSLDRPMNFHQRRQLRIIQLHEVRLYLKNMEVASFLVLAQFELCRPAISSPADIGRWSGAPLANFTVVLTGTQEEVNRGREARPGSPT